MVTDVPEEEEEKEKEALHIANAAPNNAEFASSDVLAQSKSHTAWPKEFNYKEYIALKRGKERKAYLMSFASKYGLQIPTTTTATTTAPCLEHISDQKNVDEVYGGPKDRRRVPEKQYMRTNANNAAVDMKKTRNMKPKWSIPQNFTWPKGMNREEFLAKKPGEERMAYLAKYIRKNSIELEETTSQLSLPIGRQPDPQAHPFCRCSSSEACASCHKCMELHCVCGLTGRLRRAVCQESRACNCSLMDPTARCKLCHGCRQPHGISHCRCVLHQRLLWQKRRPDSVSELTTKEEDNVCSCFLLAHRHGGADATRKKQADVVRQIERVRRMKRAIGFPSSDNLYRDKKVINLLGDEGLESDYDDGVDDGPCSEVFQPSTSSVIPRTMTRRLLDTEYCPASYHPLFRSEGCSLLESIEPRNGRISRNGNAALNSDAMQGEICRGLENIAFELDRNDTMPPDELVDYLVYVASVKSVNIGELIGTFDDTAAVAASIVIEEYMTQLIKDTAIHQRALCPLTEASAQAFTRECIMGLNWCLFEQQHPFVPSDPTNRFTSLVEKEEMLKNKLAALIQHEFVSTQPNRLNKIEDKKLSQWIRSAIDIPSFVLTGTTEADVAGLTENLSSETAALVHQITTANSTHPTRQIRLSVKANSMTGNPSYDLQFAAMLEDGHHIKTSVGGLDSKIRANSTIFQLENVIERQERRSKGILVDPLKAPGPPPNPRPRPPQDPDDAYGSMFRHVWEHFNACDLQNWKESMDSFLNVITPGCTTARRDAKRQGTGSWQKKSKRQKTVSN
ncbi:uncharacterized protein PHALS_03057 [Plasmopara halstedii]|uniref:Uncharacterized protein n=1 Tax=Plasmopara halstedii TaxID=4781 RepID=A0A0P1A866_PLAHL|nr:uncharacterized protein PHALS_03057 [Plasmopara halstedii]CEG36509.1 hypothetical protein PHALS_03057 [Plasmopara halstedii]|eukprot:XP_024572878.1 hypothetical protein PHALS_03057 [Plasmopara halstedii]